MLGIVNVTKFDTAQKIVYELVFLDFLRGHAVLTQHQNKLYWLDCIKINFTIKTFLRKLKKLLFIHI